jgi:hypothetical protein
MSMPVTLVKGDHRRTCALALGLGHGGASPKHPAPAL